MSRHRKISTVCHFLDLPIEFCEYRYTASVPISILMSEIVPNLWYFYPVSNGVTYKLFGYLHWCTNWWRHRYDSYNLNLRIKSSDGELAFLDGISLWLRYPWKNLKVLKLKILSWDDESSKMFHFKVVYYKIENLCYSDVNFILHIEKVFEVCFIQHVDIRMY